MFCCLFSQSKISLFGSEVKFKRNFPKELNSSFVDSAVWNKKRVYDTCFGEIDVLTSNIFLGEETEEFLKSFEDSLWCDFHTWNAFSWKELIFNELIRIHHLKWTPVIHCEDVQSFSKIKGVPDNTVSGWSLQTSHTKAWGYWIEWNIFATSENKASWY